MDKRTGQFAQYDLMAEFLKAENRLEDIQEMVIPPTEKQIRRGRIGRNDPCPCGSNKKFKKCCLRHEN